MENKKFVIIYGYPASGKGTQSKVVCDVFGGLSSLATGDCFRAIKARGEQGAQLTEKEQIALDHMLAGKLVPDDITLEIVFGENGELAKPEYANGALLDGFPRTIVQAKALDEYLTAKGLEISAVIYLDTDKNLIRGRMDKRNADTIAAGKAVRDDDKWEIMEGRLQAFDQSTAPVLEYYKSKGIVLTIDNNGSIETASEEIKQKSAELLQKQNGPASPVENLCL